MSLLDVSIVAVALPSIQRGLGTSPSAVQWVVSGYALTFGLALVPAGRLGDAIGRRRMFLVGAGRVRAVQRGGRGGAEHRACSSSARLAQGIAAGSLAPQNSALIQQLFRGAERGRAFGFFGSTVGLSTAVGPIVGGVILAVAGEPDGWRWIFFVNVPIGVVALRARRAPAPAGRSGPRTEHIDLVGVGLLGGGVLALMLPLVLAEAGGLGPAVVAVPAGRCGARRLRVLGATRRGRAAASRCSTSGCSPTPPATRPARCSARSTSSGSAGSGWCSRSTCRPGWATRRCSRG